MVDNEEATAYKKQAEIQGRRQMISACAELLPHNIIRTARAECFFRGFRPTQRFIAARPQSQRKFRRMGEPKVKAISDGAKGFGSVRVQRSVRRSSNQF
jgi:hypothetical protein